MKLIESTRLNERYYEVDHPSGLKILICPKEGYASTYAIFGTRYGSIDTRFRRAGEADWRTVPEGIAHFLEHKLFENKDGDAFSRYAKTGASANAYTAFDRTCYLFSCTENFAASLEILLDFVQSPYFTPETVQKEQGIIGQEIRMYDDAPDWRVLFNLLTALYHNHPVRIDIAGTVDSIARIDADLLYDCYRTFYNLGNMALAVAGNVDPAEVIAIADRRLKPAPAVPVERAPLNEPDAIKQPRVEQRLAVVLPLFVIGFKELPKEPMASPRELVETQLILEMLTGKASPLYRKLLDEGLVNQQFGSEFFEGFGYAACLISGESHDPDAVAAAVTAAVDSMRREGIDPGAFESAKRELYGRAIRCFNSVEGIANGLAAAQFTGRPLFSEADCLAAVTPEDITARLGNILRADHMALSVILPA